MVKQRRTEVSEALRGLIFLGCVISAACGRDSVVSIHPEPQSYPTGDTETTQPAQNDVEALLPYVTKTATAPCRQVTRSTDGTTTTDLRAAWIRDPELTLDNFVSVETWSTEPPAVPCSNGLCVVVDNDFPVDARELLTASAGVGDGSLSQWCFSDTLTSVTFRYTFMP